MAIFTNRPFLGKQNSFGFPLMSVLQNSIHKSKMKPQVVGIVGFGNEGRGFWSPFFKKLRYTVLSSDKAEDNQWIVDQASIVVLATPMHITPELIRSLRFRPDQRVIAVVGEWSATKEALLEIPADSMLLHRMCGPIADMHGQNLIMHTVKSSSWENDCWFKAIVGEIGANTVASNPDEHDRHIGVTQSLLRLVLICFFVALLELKVSLKGLRAFSSPPFRIFLLVMCRILGQGAELCFDMLSSNRFAKEAISAMQGALTNVADLIEKGDRAGFAALFASFHSHVEPDKIWRANQAFGVAIGQGLDKW